MRTIKIICLAISILISTANFAQGRHGGGKRGGHGNHRGNGHRNGHKVVVVKRSPYRPHKVFVYHPVWHPKYAYNRRWVYFPKYNFYWDNWRNHYRFWNGTIWLTQTAPPPAVININLSTEKHYELKDNDDDNDDIDVGNNDHRSKYKAE